MKKRLNSEIEALEKRIRSLQHSVGQREIKLDYLANLVHKVNSGQHILFGRKAAVSPKTSEITFPKKTSLL